MNTAIKALMPLAFFLITSVHSKAQNNLPRDFVAFSWEMAIPSTNDFLEESSYSGWRAEYRRMIKPNFSVGLGLSWNTFDELLPKQTYTSEDGGTAVHTDMIRQLITVPITLTGHYYFSKAGKLLQPYVGVGLGAQYAENNVFFNIYQIQDNN